eukprot:RCo007628
MPEQSPAPAADPASRSKKPEDTPFKQQRLPAWQPVLSPPWVISCFLVVACAFIPIGAVIIIASGKVVEYEVQYDNLVCLPVGSPSCTTWAKISIDREMTPPVYVWYKLDNFYQNNRRYAQSRSDAQLAGQSVSSGDISTCDPIQYYGPGPSSFNRMYAPCGLIAWSMFNDSFEIFTPNINFDGVDCSLNQTHCQRICAGTLAALYSEPATLCTKNGIAWASDVNKKFKAPAVEVVGGTVIHQVSNPNPSNSARPNYYFGEEPPNYFNLSVTPDFEAGHVIPIQTDEDFMVWMRTASLPTFRKLYRRFDTYTFPAGSTIFVKVTNRFGVSMFGGHKYFVIGTQTWIGGKNYFLGISYVVVGGVCFLLALVFVVKLLFTPRSGRDLPDISQPDGRKPH